jgi:hypothetical protein
VPIPKDVLDFDLSARAARPKRVNRLPVDRGLLAMHPFVPVPEHPANHAPDATLIHFAHACSSHFVLSFTPPRPSRTIDNVFPGRREHRHPAANQ